MFNPLSPCAEWPKTIHRSGYGVLTVDGKQWGAHRWTWTQAHGPIPKGLIVRHKCDNPPCVNLDHLELGTHADNARDREERDRGRNQHKGATHCKFGHEFTPDNTYTYAASGKRMCRTCARRLNRERKARARDARQQEAQSVRLVRG